MAYRLFTKPQKGRLYKNHLPQLFQESFTEKIIDKDTFIQYYIWKGGENIVLLLHGWESNATRWELLIQKLKQRSFTIIALDAPAHGLSHGTEFNIIKYAEFIDVLAQKYNPQYIIGHSMGGITMLYYLSHFSHHSIRKAMALGTPNKLKTMLDNFITLLGINKKVTRLLYTYFQEHKNIIVENFSSKVFASHIQLKGTIIHDVYDSIVSFSDGQQIAQAWKQAQFIKTEGFGHSLQNEQVYQYIFNFLTDSDV